jgi:hypothetical protein
MRRLFHRLLQWLGLRAAPLPFLTRLPDPQPGQQTICLLPWLRLDGEVAFGKVKLAPFTSVREALEGPAGETAAAITASFRDRRGNPVEPSICWFADRHPTAALTEEDVEVLREHIALAALAAIGANSYLTHRPQMNAAHFQRIYQNFEPGTETVALIRRRRDGYMISAGWKIAELRETIPAAADSGAQPQWDQPLLDAFAAAGETDDLPSTLLRQSLPLFLQGSELDEWETHGQEVVWIGSALEQMCDVSGNRKNQQMAEAITAALGTAWDAPQKRTMNRWMDEFYAKRSEIHGAAAGRDTWPYWAHALLGTVTYVLMVKHLLAGEHHYELTNHDEDAAAALPHRIECLKEADQKPQDEFASCWNRATWEGAVARIARRFTGT